LRPRLDFLLDELPEDLERDELRCDPLELLFFAEVELRRERDDLVPLFFAADERDFPDRDEELDLLRDELFLRAVAMRSSLLSCIQTHTQQREVVLGPYRK